MSKNSHVPIFTFASFYTFLKYFYVKFSKIAYFKKSHVSIFTFASFYTLQKYFYGNFSGSTQKLILHLSYLVGNLSYLVGNTIPTYMNFEEKNRKYLAAIF